VKAGHTDMNVTENTLMEKLSQKGFLVVDHAVKSRNLNISDPYRIESLDNSAIQAIGNLFDAEVVIYGKALAKMAGSVMETSMKSAQADVSLRAVNTDTGQVIASSSNHAAAIHPSEETAGAKALQIATESIADRLMEQIAERWSSDLTGGGMIQLVIAEVDSYQHLVQFKEMVQNQVRGVSGLYQRNFDSGIATIDITTTRTAHNLADELEALNYGSFAIDIMGITQNAINMKMTR
jgi:hypothetical protein